nr:G-protein coupled bile acid receptor 1 isoform X1 [Macaca fascicularis]XP_015288251.2 G-protein coupled bile acid receptor 1 isoform X1 [Macaca fascicularis]XP_015288252.2 G-protein coupled bile acid receptor 1 isoform X1 [Macaca fascicularis]XP_015288253.2 G-protein coupled bile acid receptor 1 isoform X1 [Macaca fascicularis]XP_015288254.2 G-protein coupled bile acid receptor 1 isoform X1 [Macaca fascicularis]XP_045223629.1 G-protein coupled bile acid receptor 1 isoform X1 [Macaca fascicu
MGWGSEDPQAPNTRHCRHHTRKCGGSLVYCQLTGQSRGLNVNASAEAGSQEGQDTRHGPNPCRAGCSNSLTLRKAQAGQAIPAPNSHACRLPLQDSPVLRTEMTPNSTGEVPSPIPKGVLGLSLALASLIVTANLLLALGIAWDRHLRSPPAGCFFLSLLLAGLLTGLALPTLPGLWNQSRWGYWSCLLLYLAPNFSFLSLLANLLLVHGERYIAVLRPLQPPGSTRLALLLTWAGPLLFASLPALGWNHWTPGANCSSQAIFPAPYLYLEVYGLLLPAVGAAALLSVRVLVTAHRQLQDIRRLERAVCRDEPSALAQALTWRQARAQAGAMLLFGLCWGPYVATLLLSVLAYEQRPPLGPGTLLSLISLGSASAAAVPVAMGLGDRRYTAPWRAAAQRCLQGLRGRASRDSPGPSTAYHPSSQSSVDLDLN